MEKLWTDLHANIHHNQIDDLDKWIDHIKKIMDFWPIAYYPFHMVKTEEGAGLEALIDDEDMFSDWEKIREAVKNENKKGFPMFMGYEWQGSGLDGDHNVFFLSEEADIRHPYRYEELRDEFKDIESIAIPHHIAYQLGSRGKNWNTHDEAFSPFAEIYSSHGCSENDENPLDMERHLHMGPRTGQTCYEVGLEMGFHVGCMASGDNHKNPAVYDNGSMCVIAEDNTRESIFDGMKKRHVYGVSRSRMDIDFGIDDAITGDVIKVGHHILHFDIEAADAIDRIEILKNNVIDEMYINSGKWERNIYKEDDIVSVKFATEFGWGPNPRFYKDMIIKNWDFEISTDAEIISAEKAWNSFGQEVIYEDKHNCKYKLKSYMSTQSGHWMGPSAVSKEGFVFNIKGRYDEDVCFRIDGYEYHFTLAQLMKGSRILAEYNESLSLAKKTYNYKEYYRDDFIWHNAYKTRIRKAVPKKAYSVTFQKNIYMEKGDQYRIRVILKNGDRAWVSPIFAI